MQSGPSLQEIRGFQRRGAEVQRELAANAKEVGGLVLIHVPLPFKLPLVDGFKMGWDNDEARFLELVHYPYHPTEHVGEPIFTDTLEPTQLDFVNGMRTVVRFGTPLPLEAFEGTTTVKAHPDFADYIHRFPTGFEIEVSLLLGALIDDGLIALNHLIRSYRILEKGCRIRPVDGKERLPATLLYTVWDIREAMNLQFGIKLRQREDIAQVDQGILLIHPEQPTDRGRSDYQRTGKIVTLTSQALDGVPHPFYIAMDLIQSAYARLSEGDYGSAVIDAATGIEAYVHAFARLDMEHRKVKPEKVESRLQAGFRNLLEVRFARPLGSNFDPGAPSNAFDQWYSSAYKLRNKVVHEGYVVNRMEAIGAVEEASLFLTATYEGVMVDPKRFPEIARLIS